MAEQPIAVAADVKHGTFVSISIVHNARCVVVTYTTCGDGRSSCAVILPGDHGGSADGSEQGDKLHFGEDSVDLISDMCVIGSR